jgi:hypothetical protein
MLVKLRSQTTRTHGLIVAASLLTLILAAVLSFSQLLTDSTTARAASPPAESVLLLRISLIASESAKPSCTRISHARDTR